MAAVDAIGSLEQDRCIDECVEDRFAREFIGLEAPRGLRYRHPQLGRLEEFAFDTDQEILDPAMAARLPRLVISHAWYRSNSRAYVSGVNTPSDAATTTCICRHR